MNHNPFLDYIQKFNEKKILVIGDLMLDKYIVGPTKLAPEAPVPDLTEEKTLYRLGGAANVANNISALGATAYLFGVVGDDENAEILKNLIKTKNNKIKPFYVTDKKKPTTTKTRFLDKEFGQQVFRFNQESIEFIGKDLENLIFSEAQKIIQEIDGIIISDYSKGVMTPTLAGSLIKEATPKIPVFVDAKPEHINYYSGCYLIKPNLYEAELIVGRKLNIKDSKDIREFGKTFLSKTNSKYAVITLGKNGMLICDEEYEIIPTFAQEVFDVSGAGDTSISALALSNLIGASIYDSAMISNYAAGIKVKKKGTAPVYAEELIEILKLKGKIK